MYLPLLGTNFPAPPPSRPSWGNLSVGFNLSRTGWLAGGADSLQSPKNPELFEEQTEATYRNPRIVFPVFSLLQDPTRSLLSNQL